MCVVICACAFRLTSLYMTVCMYDVAGAMADSDNDYCISYTVTVVDVRGCTRPSRSPGEAIFGKYAGSQTHT